MSLHPHWGHGPLRKALARARQRESLPAALLIHGSRGVGKQHLGLWIGRLLLCRTPGPEGPCEACQDCRLAGKVEHPDLHWYFPLPRPRNASTPEKLADALEEARGETLKEIRKDSLRPPPPGEARVLYLAAARTLRRQAQRRPAMGPHQVFLIADAEALAPQASSSEAANALLKLLEEPPPGTTLILTSSEPGRLLPTIRSRTTQLHLPPLSPEEVTEFLVQVAAASPDEALRLAKLSGGSIGRALGFRERDGEPGPLAEVRREALSLLSAALGPPSFRIFQAALDFKSVGARGLLDLMDFLEEGLRDLALLATGQSGTSGPAEVEGALRDILARRPIQPTRVAEALERVEEARVLATGNVNPQLLIFGLLQALRRQLQADGDSPSPGS